MSDYGFAFAGALVVFFVFVPALTLVAKAALWLRRWRSGDVAGLGSSAAKAATGAALAHSRAHQVMRRR